MSHEEVDSKDLRIFIIGHVGHGLYTLPDYIRVGKRAVLEGCSIGTAIGVWVYQEELVKSDVELPFSNNIIAVLQATKKYPASECNVINSAIRIMNTIDTLVGIAQ